MDIVRVCRPDPNQSIFVLGGLSWRVSLHTQQKRVVSLVEALKSDLVPGVPVAVIGGGVAGVTCAAALVSKGCRVTVFERADSLMALQRKNTTRFIHPNSVTWPYTPLNSSTDLPFLNWHSAYSNEIASIIHDELYSDFVGPDYEGISIILKSNVSSVEPHGDEYRVKYNQDGKLEAEDFTAIFFATGFGKERKISGYDNYSYWEDTSPIPIGSSFDDIRIAIIGDGDGALVEFIRCTWGGMNFDELYRFVADKFIRLPGDLEKIRSAEETARRLFPKEPDNAQQLLADIYRSNILSPNGKSFLRSRMSGMAKLTIISKFVQPFSPKASPIHKVLLGFCLTEGLVDFRTLDAKNVEYIDSRYHVRGLSGGKDASLGPFHRVLERIGPAKEYCPLVQGTFKPDTLTAFATLNGLELDVGNPANISKSCPTQPIVGPYGERLPIVIATANLQRYFRANYPDRLTSVSVGKKDNKEDSPPCFIASYNIGNDDLRQDGPRVYFGYEVIYKRATGPARGLSGQSEEALAVSEGESELAVTAGQLVTNMSRPDQKSFGRISVFVKPKSGVLGSEPEKDPEIYMLTAAHALYAKANDKVGLQGGGKLRKIGRVDVNKFADRMSRWQKDPNYMCLKDVAIIRVDSDIVPLNRAGNNIFDTVKDPIEHFLWGDGSVFVKGRMFGRISQVKSTATFIAPDGNRVRTSGFFIQRTDPSIEIAPGSSGRPVLTKKGELLGMVLAGTENEIFCLDLSEVLSRLDCDLIDADERMVRAKGGDDSA